MASSEPFATGETPGKTVLAFSLNYYWDSGALEWVEGTQPSSGGGTQYTEDAAAAANPTGTVPILVRTDTPAAAVTTDGDNIAQRGTNYGAAYVTLLDAAGAAVAIGGGTQYTEDAAAAANPTGNAPILVRADTPAAVVTTDGDNVAQRGTNYGAAYVTLLDSGGSPVAVGGGTQYTEADTDASITGTAMLMEGAANALVPAQGTAADGLLVNLGANNDVTVTGSVTANAGTNLNTSALALEAGGNLAAAAASLAILDNIVAGSEAQVDVVTSALPTGASTLAEQQSQTTHLATIAGDTTSIQTAVELIDDAVATLGTTTYTEGASKGLVLGAIRRDADTTLVDTTNEVAPLQVDANGRLKVEAFSGETLPVSIATLPALATGANNIGDVDVLTLPALPAGTNNIGDVDVLTLPNVTLAAGTNTNEVVGDVAHDSPAAGNPLLEGGFASAAAPTDVSADADVVRAWRLRNGAAATVLTAAGALIGGDATNGLDVDVTRLPALAAGTANIGDVDVLTVPADPFGVNADAASATGSISAKLRFIAATGIPVTALPALAAGTANIGDVDVLSLPALVAGTANIGDVDVASIAAGDNNIGNVDIVTMPNVTLAAGTNTNEVVGDAAHDAAAAGNPILNAGIAQDMDDTAPPNRVSAEADAVRLAADRDGALFVHPHGPQVWSYHSDGSTALTDATVHAAPGAGLSLYVTDIIISSGAATAMNAFFEESATKVLGPYYLEAVAGRGVAIRFATPKKITANTALTVTTSAAIAHSVDVTGFTAQG